MEKETEESSEVEQEVSDEEAMEQLRELAGIPPTPEEKHNVHTFLHNVVMAPDTTKLGYLTEDEIGMPKLPLRTYKELALFCGGVAGMKEFGEYFDKEAEILTSTSLSKEAKLLSLAVIQRKETASIEPPPRKENRGWFKRKQKYPQSQYG